MRARCIPIAAVLLASPLAARAQEPSEGAFGEAAAAVQSQLEESLAELALLREEIAAEMIPLSRELRDLEAELVGVRAEYNSVSRALDSRMLEVDNLRTGIQSRREEAAYLSNLLADYIRNFEAGLHIAEIQRYEQAIEAAKLAPENTNLSPQEVYRVQSELLALSLERLHEALGGARFEGAAVDPAGMVARGTFVLVGPIALFRSQDGTQVGTAEQRLGSLEPAVIPFANPKDAQAASRLVTEGEGDLPLDPTLGNAHKIEFTQESLWEHVRKGGPVMVPIFALAGAALLVALYKWITLAFLRKPSRRLIEALLDAAGRGDEEAARQWAAGIRGPAGRMLAAGVEHMREPRDLIEEVMYEKVLTTRLKLERLLPFISISAASAPLLGLLGTVTGIINTFKLITVFGSGDVKTLSGGISEALITTEFGLIVAIPSLLLHAFLSRKVRGVIGQMETAAVAFANQVSRSRPDRGGEGGRRLAPAPSSSSGEDVEILPHGRDPGASGGEAAAAGARHLQTEHAESHPNGRRVAEKAAG